VKKKPNIKATPQDIEDWESFVNNINSIENKDTVLDSSEASRQSQNLFDLRRDLHGFKMHEALDLVYETMHLAFEKKYRKILFITGKGLHSNKENDPYASKDLSLLRYAVPDYLNKEFGDKIIAIEESPIKLGGSGSIIVFLKKL
jgi:DNA-nicking Smr family endonuclease